MFWCVSYHLGPLCFLTKLGAKHSELVQKFVPRSQIGIFHNERTQSTPNDPKLMFWCVSYHLGAFGTVRLPYKTRDKTGRTCKSSCHEVALEFFAMNPPDPLHWSLNSCFWCVSYRLGVFATIWLPYETRGKTFRTSAKVRATKSRPNFSQRTHLILPIKP